MNTHHTRYNLSYSISLKRDVFIVFILDQKLYNNATEDIISDTSKFEKLSEDSALKREASLQRLLRKLKQKNFFNEI